MGASAAERHERAIEQYVRVLMRHARQSEALASELGRAADHWGDANDRARANAVLGLVRHHRLKALLWRSQAAALVGYELPDNEDA